MMPRPVGVIDILIVVAKAILITAAILYCGSFFGLHVREAGGHGMAAGLSASDIRSISDGTRRRYDGTDPRVA